MHCACNAESPTRFQLKSRRQGFSPLGVIALCPDISWEMMSNQVSWPDMRHSLQVPGGQPGQDPHHSGHTHTPHTVRKNSAKIEISRNIYSWGGVQVIYRWNLSDIWVSCHPWVNIRWSFNFRRFFLSVHSDQTVKGQSHEFFVWIFSTLIRCTPGPKYSPIFTAGWFYDTFHSIFLSHWNARYTVNNSPISLKFLI